MFGINRRSDKEKILTLKLKTTANSNGGYKERTTITRNRNPQGRRKAGMNLYHRADQILMRLRIGEGLSR